MLGIIGDVVCILYLLSLPALIYFFDPICNWSMEFINKRLEGKAF